MESRSKHVISNLLLTVFVGIILMKPVHLLLFDHKHYQNIQKSEQQNSKDGDGCFICQFTFDLSTEAVFHAEEVIFLHLISEIQPLVKADFVCFIAKHVSLRAPPFLQA